MLPSYAVEASCLLAQEEDGKETFSEAPKKSRVLEQPSNSPDKAASDGYYGFWI